MERAPDCALLRPPLIQKQEDQPWPQRDCTQTGRLSLPVWGTCRYGAWISGMGSGCLRRCEGSGLHLMGRMAWHGRRRLPETAPRSLAGRQSTQYAALAIRGVRRGDHRLRRSRPPPGLFDPFRREMHLGLGCAIENFVLAARVFGIATDVDVAKGRFELSPGPQPVVAARIALGPAKPSSDPLFDAIPKRRTHRGPYRDQPIVPERLRQLANLVSSQTLRVVFLTDDVARREIGGLIVEATERIIEDRDMSLDSFRWIRTGRRDVHGPARRRDDRHRRCRPAQDGRGEALARPRCGRHRSNLARCHPSDADDERRSSE